jgi:hypothetical protein
MRLKAFRFCMGIGALALAGLALFYFLSYIGVAIAINNSGVQPFYKQSIRALWLTFGCQALLIGLLYALVSWKPHAVSREIIVIFGLLQLVEAVLLFSFSGSGWAVALLIAAATCVLLGAVLWPKRLPNEAPASRP